MARYKILLHAIITCFLFGINANASDATQALSNQPDKQLFVEADTLYYDKERDLIYSKGNVVLTYQKQILNTDELFFLKKENKIFANGNVVLQRPDGSVVYGDKANFDKELYAGKVINFSARFMPKSLLASSSAIMYHKELMSLNNAAYTTCKVCESNFFPNVPLWQIRAKKATLDKEDETLKYQHASIQAFGVPVAYTPYMSMPAPGAKRKSGLLFPTLKTSRDFGMTYKQPIYINIAPNMDATISPRFQAKKGHLLEGQFRHLTNYGAYELNGSFTNTDKINKDGTRVVGSEEIRAHYKAKGLFSLPNSYFTESYVGFDSSRVYDKSRTYLKKYDISHEDVLNTDIHQKNYYDNNYVFTNVLYFQGLRQNDDWNTSPRALPWFRTYYTKDVPSIKNTKLRWWVDFLNLNRNQGGNYQRFSSTVEANSFHILPFGTVFKIIPRMRADFYKINQKPLLINNERPIYENNGKEGDKTYFQPELDSTISLPLINHTQVGSFIIEPTANLIVAPDNNKSDVIFNEDSQYFELSALNLFNNNRFLGLDKLEVGSRANYGAKLKYNSSNIENVGLFIGQTYNLKKHDKYEEKSGLNTKQSDYVSEFSVQPNENLYLVHKLRLDHNNQAVLRNEIFSLASFNKWNFGINYNQVGNKLIVPGQSIYKKDVHISGAYNFYDAWWIGMSTRRKLGTKIEGLDRKIGDAANLNYLGDCLHVFFTVQRNYTQLKDLRPSTTYSINFQIPAF